MQKKLLRTSSSLLSNPYCILYLIIFILLFQFSSCKKDIINTDNNVKLKFSGESVLFDTVFTTIGSVTKQLKIYNTNNQKIKISNIRLIGGSNSMFSINVNGYPKPSVSDIEIAAKDSLFIFVKVTVDPRNSNNPLVVKDSIMFSTNNNIQYVKLIAWGQDAYFHVANTYESGLPPYIIVADSTESITWKNDKPHVVYGYAVVYYGTLTIPEGTKIHFYNNSGLWVYKYGKLQVKGTKNNPVIFQGTRLEPAYREIPGQWDRIWLNEGSYSDINYAVIKNAFVGIQAETLIGDINLPTTDLILSNTKIENCSGMGILARNYRIDAYNCVVANCGQYGIALTLGGDYDFYNCTLGNYWDYNVRQTPSLVLNNYLGDSQGNYIKGFNLHKANFGNCIIWGNIEEEMLLSKGQKKDTFNYAFDHCLIKTKLNISDANYYKSIVLNKDPLFKNTKFNDYHILTGSPARNAGSVAILYNSFLLRYDLDGNDRYNASPTITDLGAYLFK